MGLWEHTKGKSIQENDDEVFVVLRGKGKIILDDKTTLELEPGTRVANEGQGRRWRCGRLPQGLDHLQGGWRPLRGGIGENLKYSL